ncbi:MAG: response regulator transcription factor [Hydrogenophilales bacterium]|nr:response regulator transcription factor [Hydrogenophilales bacterium]
MKHALIVEDLPDTQAWLTRLIVSAFPDIRCLCANSVESALALSRRESFQLALVDLGLPDGDGTRVIESLNSLESPPVIVVASIFDDDRHLFPALQAGAQGYLLKDQPMDQLVANLRGILDGNPPLSPAIARRLLGFFKEPAPGGESLTAREKEALGYLARGMKVAEMAEAMGITRHTASDHVKSVYRKLNVSSRAQATLHAVRMGLIQ